MRKPDFGIQVDGFSGQFFLIFDIRFVCFIVAIIDPVQDVDAIFLLP